MPVLAAGRAVALQGRIAVTPHSVANVEPCKLENCRAPVHFVCQAQVRISSQEADSKSRRMWYTKTPGNTCNVSQLCLVLSKHTYLQDGDGKRAKAGGHSESV